MARDFLHGVNRSCSQSNALDATLKVIYEEGLGNRNLKIKKKKASFYTLYICWGEKDYLSGLHSKSIKILRGDDCIIIQ